MAEKITLKAKKRILLGRKIRQLRRQGILPVNLYGKKIKSQSLQINEKEFNKIFDQAGETSVIYLEIEGSKENHPVLISNVQLHPVSDARLHVDFRQVDLTQKVKANVPVDLQGESLAVTEGAVLVQQFNELEVEALPTHIPESIIFDISQLKQVGNSLKLSDAKAIKDITFELEANTTIVLIQEAKQEEEPIPAPTEEETPEGEIPEEGEAKPEADKGETKPEDKTKPEADKGETKPQTYKGETKPKADKKEKK